MALSPPSTFHAGCNENQPAMDAISELVDLYAVRNERGKRIAALKVSTALQQHTSPITSVDQAKLLNGVGDTMASVIMDAMRGTLSPVISNLRQ